MKKVLRNNLLLSLGLIVGCSSIILLGVEKNKLSSVEASSYTTASVPKNLNLNDTSASDIRNYYSSLNSLSTSERQGTNLLKNLKPILKNGQKYYSYDSGATKAVWQAYEIVDRDWVKSPASEISGYNPSTGMVTNYTYGTGISSPGLPYVHALYVNRDVDNQTTAWGDHDQDQWGINQEHTWPKSLGFDDNSKGTGARGDLMHLWAGNGKANNIHSNYFYGYVDTSKTYYDVGSYKSTLSGNLRGNSRTLGGTETVFEPQDSDKGDIARAMFYMAARYNYLSGSDSDGIDAGNPNLEIINSLSHNSSFTSSTTVKGQIGVLQDLLEWNRLDPPDEWEIHRNNLCYNNFTNNRNPFIDFPEWAEYIWGTCSNGSYNSASTGYAIPNGDNINEFGNVGDTPKVNSVTVSPSYVELDLNGTTTKNLTASVSVSNGAPQTVNWSSSNISVATVSSSGVVTAVGVGTCTITATSTFNSEKKGTAEIKVRNTGGSVIEDDYTFDLTIASYDENPSEELVTWTGTHFTMTNERNGSSNTKVNNYLGGDSNNRTSSRMYTNNLLTITPLDDYEITSIVFNSTSGNYATALDSSTWTNATSSVLGSVVTVVPTDGKEEIKATIGGTCGFTSIKINYKYYSGLPVVTLTDISLETSDVQTVFTVGDAFNYDHLVVTANYSDNSHTTIGNGDFTITSPDMSKSGNKTITVTYEGKSASYSIIVNPPEASSITATVSKIYHPGDVISNSDIHVVDNLNNEITSFEFANSGYQIKYADTPSGGTKGTKTFENAITYGSLSCSLTVETQRENRTDISSEDVVDTLTAADLTATSNTYVDFDNVSKTSNAIYKGQSAKSNGGGIQLRTKNSNSGIVTTSSGGTIKNISVTVESGENTVDIYAKNSPYLSASDLYGSNQEKGTKVGSLSATGTIDFEKFDDNYTYLGIRSNNNAIYLSSVEITYEGAGQDTATNVANYIMYADNEGQCQTKFDVAQGYFEGLSDSEKVSFMTSDDYVISTARTRFSAWAAHLGKVITTDGDGKYIIQNAKFAKTSPDGQLNLQEDSSLMILFIICILGAGSLSAFYLVKKKKKN